MYDLKCYFFFLSFLEKKLIVKIIVEFHTTAVVPNSYVCNNNISYPCSV